MRRGHALAGKARGAREVGAIPDSVFGANTKCVFRRRAVMSTKCAMGNGDFNALMTFIALIWIQTAQTNCHLSNIESMARRAEARASMHKDHKTGDGR